MREHIKLEKVKRSRVFTEKTRLSKWIKDAIRKKPAWPSFLRKQKSLHRASSALKAEGFECILHDLEIIERKQKKAKVLRSKLRSVDQPLGGSRRETHTKTTFIINETQKHRLKKPRLIVHRLDRLRNDNLAIADLQRTAKAISQQILGWQARKE